MPTELLDNESETGIDYSGLFGSRKKDSRAAYDLKELWRDSHRGGYTTQPEKIQAQYTRAQICNFEIPQADQKLAIKIRELYKKLLHNDLDIELKGAEETAASELEKEFNELASQWY